MRRQLLGCSALAALAAGLLAIPTAFAAANPAVVHAPRLRAKPPSSSSSTSFGWASSNWSGYALASSQPGTYTAISGSWVVPQVAPSKKPTYSAAWVGIDGFNNSDLIQTGTEQDFVNGSARYYAWWEVLPAPETVITTTSNGTPFLVQPGDKMTASIQDNGGSWTITLTDASRQESYSTTVSYSGPLTSAEWILEAPTVGGRVATLANYGQTAFDPGTVNGGLPALVPADGGVMVQNGRQVSTPSGPDGDADGFAVQYGSTVPKPPSS